ncbi:MAG: hypothetical protein J6X66_05380 [Lachnospiraceae bacterium]|nr:hypothetical protein [Lachnospiraceae bacterium]
MKKTGLLRFGVLAVLIFSFLLLGGCGEKGIEGEWILVEEVTADGEVLKEDDLEEAGISEEYSIEGEDIHYTCNMALMDKPIEFDLTLEETGKNKYDFKLKNMVFASVELKGDTLTYTAGEGENSSQMKFKRK